MIEVVNYRKVYGETEAVKDLSFEVPAGAVLGMVGPNGAGKTTTLRAICGVIRPTDGTIQVAGHDIVDSPILAKQTLAYIPDEPRLFESLTVWEHIQFTAAAFGVSKFEEQADQLLEQFELTDKRDELVQDLSRGMRQKVAICCAYIHHPKVILFDEPHTGLDPMSIRTMKTTVLERAKEGASVIVSSHLLSLIEDLCSHLLIMSKGEALFCGTLEEARSQYDDLEEGTTLEDVFFRATKE